jgi:Sec-independent protein translocase protein TatA
VLAFIDNFQLSEAFVIAVVAVLIFGRRLPHAAGQAAAHVARARRALNELWRDSGLEQEMRSVQREIERARALEAFSPRPAAGAEARRPELAPPRTAPPTTPPSAGAASAAGGAPPPSDAAAPGAQRDDATASPARHGPGPDDGARPGER